MELIVHQSTAEDFLRWIETDEYQPQSFLNQTDPTPGERRKAMRVVPKEPER